MIHDSRYTIHDLICVFIVHHVSCIVHPTFMLPCPLRKRGKPFASLGPTVVCQPSSFSSIDPLNIATCPRDYQFLCFTSFSMPLSLMKAAIFDAVNLPAAHAVNTDNPSQSITASLLGTLLFSISPETIKYVREKFVVIISGESCVGSRVCIFSAPPA